MERSLQEDGNSLCFSNVPIIVTTPQITASLKHHIPFYFTHFTLLNQGYSKFILLLFAAGPHLHPCKLQWW